MFLNLFVILIVLIPLIINLTNSVNYSKNQSIPVSVKSHQYPFVVQSLHLKRKTSLALPRFIPLTNRANVCTGMYQTYKKCYISQRTCYTVLHMVFVVRNKVIDCSAVRWLLQRSYSHFYVTVFCQKRFQLRSIAVTEMIWI